MSGLGEIFKKPKPPEARPTAVMPDMADPVVREAGRRRVRQETARSGREGTQLTGNPVTYGSSELGR